MILYRVKYNLNVQEIDRKILQTCVFKQKRKRCIAANTTSFMSSTIKRGSNNEIKPFIRLN